MAQMTMVHNEVLEEAELELIEDLALQVNE